MKKKTKKAWAILNDKNSIVSVEFGASKPKWFTIGTWQFSTKGSTVISCTISYSLPIKTKK